MCVRASDWFFASIESYAPDFQGLVVDGAGEPLSLVVNPQPFNLEMCAACNVVYPLKPYRRLSKVCECGLVRDPTAEVCTCGKKDEFRRLCACGKHDQWVSHFATFPENMVAPCILAGSSEYGCCSQCSSPYERVLESVTYGDWNGQKRGSERTAVAKMANWTKVDRAQSKISPDGGQFAQSRLDKNSQAVRHAHKHATSGNVRNGDPVHSFAKQGGAHDQRFLPPTTLGWRPTCSHPLFPGDVVPCVVLDPFAGSGRTGLTAVPLGRSFIGLEASPQYVRLATWQAVELGILPKESYGSNNHKEEEHSRSVEDQVEAETVRGGQGTNCQGAKEALAGIPACQTGGSVGTCPS